MKNMKTFEQYSEEMLEKKCGCGEANCNCDDKKDKKEDKKEETKKGLTAKQKKLPEGIQKAILAKQGK